MSTDDKRVREFAYQIWESEGKPEGQEAHEQPQWESARGLGGDGGHGRVQKRVYANGFEATLTSDRAGFKQALCHHTSPRDS